MSIEITVPALPESVSDGVLLEWKKSVGDAVARDEVLVELETDKVVLDIPAPTDGVLSEIVATAGSNVTAGQVLARLDSNSDSDTNSNTNTNSNGDAPAAQPQAQADAPTEAAADSESQQPLSPAVRNLVATHGIDTSRIRGSGKDGRLTKKDVMDFIAASVAPDEADESDAADEGAADATAPITPAARASRSLADAPMPQSMPPRTPAAGSRATRREPMSRLRQTIASRLVESQQNAALLSTFNEVNMQSVIALRTNNKQRFEQKHGVRLGFMSFFVKAAVAALQRYPRVNAAIDATDIVYHDYADIGIAVSSPRGLVVPILRNCEQLNFVQIETQIADFGQRAQQGKVTVDELNGGTFTITNGGVFGSLLSTPIVNPPQSAILGMHKIQPRAVVEDAAVVARPMMYLALSYDHRIIDGKEAVQFLVCIKELLEEPAQLLFEG